MSDDTTGSFDQVERGPEVSGEDGAAPAFQEGAAGDHPSVGLLIERFGDAILGHEVHSGDQHVVFVDPSRNTEVLAWLKEDESQRYDYLVDVTAVDYGRGQPLEVVYQLWSIPNRRALRIKCRLDLAALQIESLTSLWKSANWLEREVYDLFGIHFENHPDLRRILMPEDYAEGHPLRKDFPLRGRFSRAEQTRRALEQNPDHQYRDDLRAIGGEPAVVALPDELPQTLEEGES